MQLRPGRPGRKLLTADRSAVYFEPDARLYRNTCIQPAPAPLARKGNPLERLARACAAAGLDLISWTVCLHNTLLANRYPRCAQRTAYGDNLGWCLCPAEDDVRSYIVALCVDIAKNYGVKRIELESCCFGGYGHSHHHVKDGIDLGNIGRYLMGLSFSPGSRSRARNQGIDVVGLRGWVMRELDRIFAGAGPLNGDLQEFVEGRSDLAAFHQMREETIVSLVREIKAAVGVEVSFLMMGERFTTGVNPLEIARAADLVEILAYTASPEEVGARIDTTLAGLGEADPGKLVVGLQAYHPCATSAAGLEACVRSALDRGIQQLSFYNYGIMPRPNLQWIQQCING
jgi:hypothetical protein